MNFFNFNPAHYKTKIEDISFPGSKPALSLKLCQLENLNEAIDSFFSEPHEMDSSSRSTWEDLCPYFAHLWPAGKICAETVARIPSIHSWNVLEIGCGLALPSLVAAKRGAKVVATDFHPHVEWFLKQNCDINQVRIDFRSADLRDGEKIDLFSKNCWDLIVASDVLYESHQPQVIADFLSSVARNKTRIILVDPMRPYLQEFVTRMNMKSFTLEESVAENCLILQWTR